MDERPDAPGRGIDPPPAPSGNAGGLRPVSPDFGIGYSALIASGFITGISSTFYVMAIITTLSIQNGVPFDIDTLSTLLASFLLTGLLAAYAAAINVFLFPLAWLTNHSLGQPLKYSCLTGVTAGFQWLAVLLLVEPYELLWLAILLLSFPTCVATVTAARMSRRLGGKYDDARPVHRQFQLLQLFSLTTICAVSCGVLRLFQPQFIVRLFVAIACWIPIQIVVSYLEYRWRNVRFRRRGCRMG
ncbi:MAG: hypothetical protein R3E01_03005 [Pirellulaceae bacterium]